MNKSISPACGMLIGLFLLPLAVQAQEKSPSPDEILSMEEGMSSPEASLDVVQWLEGTWEGDLEGNRVEHVMLSPIVGHLPGFLRAWENQVFLYEITQFIQVGNTIEYRTKHFSDELASWEGQNGYVRHPLITVTEEAVFFDGITFAKDGPNGHVVHFRFSDGEREGETIIVHMSRVE